MAMNAPELQKAVEAEIVRAGGDLDLAIHILRNDADGAPWGAPVHDIYKAALAMRSVRKASENKEAA